MGTMTAIIVLCDKAVLIWAIPPLLPQLPDFFLDHNPTHHDMSPPLFTIPFPESVHSPEHLNWNTVSSWYFGSSQPLYFDMYCRDYKFHRFQIMLKPDLSTASLQVINTCEQTPHDFYDVRFRYYRICEDTLVSCWDCEVSDKRGVYTGSTSARSANVISDGRPAAKVLLPDYFGLTRYGILRCCPVSGRLVVMDETYCVSVVDLF